MADLHAFFDRDVYVKLACCDIWQETLKALCITHPYRLPSAGPKGARSVLRRQKLDDAFLSAVVSRVERMKAVVPVVPDEWFRAAQNDERYRKLLDVVGIDPGEAALTLMSLRRGLENRVISGDKRFLKSLAASFPELFAQLRPSLISFERCLIAVCAYQGFDAVRERLRAARGCDQSLALALGADGNADSDQFTVAMNSYDPLSEVDPVLRTG